MFTINSLSISLTRKLYRLFTYLYSTQMPSYFLSTLLYIFSFLLCNGDNEPNPGRRKLKQNSLSIWYWKLTSLFTHNFAKLTQLKGYNSIYKHDFICLSETYLDSVTPKTLLEIEGDNLVRADHLNSVNRGGFCIYYKESLPVRVINLPYFNEAFLLEMSHNSQKMIVSAIYLSPSQNNDEFDLFLSDFEKFIIDIKNRKSYLSVITDNFNARYSSWLSNDINTTEGTNLFAQTSSDGFQQLINEPTHTQKIVVLALILFSQISETCPLIIQLMHFYIQIVTIKLLMQVLIFIFLTPHNINAWYGITKKLIHPILEKPLSW